MIETSEFPHNWRAEVLPAPPLIAPARQFTYPRRVAGEEEALARGALLVLVHPARDQARSASHQPQAASGGAFLATCALGFTSPAMPTGIFACPNPNQLCAVAGGYAYLIDTASPDRSTHIPLKPVVEVMVLAAQQLLLFIGFHAIVAWGREGLAWETARLSWEGLRITGVRTGPNGTGPSGTGPAGLATLHGIGWDMPTDQEFEFTLDLRTGLPLSVEQSE